MNRSSDDPSKDSLPLLVGQVAYDRFKEMFRSADMVVPKLPAQIIAEFFCDEAYGTYCTSHFMTLVEAEAHLTTNVECGCWSPEAAYGLQFGIDDESGRTASLRDYWEGCASAPWAFDYFERSNGYSTSIGLIARSPGLFVSQQASGSASSDRLMGAFNRNLVPVLEDTLAEGAAMVVYSQYRQDAYILSSVEESWDEYAPLSRVLAPIPEGWGIVGTWSNFDEDRYSPRGLDLIASENYSVQITACARYLRDCLAL